MGRRARALIEGQICYGPERGAEATFVRTDAWLPQAPRLDEHAAQQTLLRRFLSAYGTASPRDFSRWTGIAAPAVRGIWESLAGALIEIAVEGQKCCLLRADISALARHDRSRPVFNMLPSFDPYLLGHVSKDPLVPARHYKRVFRNAGWISPVVLLDGRVVGVWSMRRSSGRIEVTVSLFERLPKLLRSRLEEETARFGSFLESPCRLRVVLVV